MTIFFSFSISLLTNNNWLSLVQLVSTAYFVGTSNNIRMRKSSGNTLILSSTSKPLRFLFGNRRDVCSNSSGIPFSNSI